MALFMRPAMSPSEMVGKKSLIVMSTTEPLLYLRKKGKEKEKEATAQIKLLPTIIIITIITLIK